MKETALFRIIIVRNNYLQKTISRDVTGQNNVLGHLSRLPIRVTTSFNSFNTNDRRLANIPLRAGYSELSDLAIMNSITSTNSLLKKVSIYG